MYSTEVSSTVQAVQDLASTYYTMREPGLDFVDCCI
jgi:hypothetical protein